MGNDIAVRQSNGLMGFQPSNFGEALEMASTLLKSRFLPQAIQTPEQALANLMLGKELGIPPMTALSNINVIKGKPTMGAAMMVAKIRSSGLCKQWRVALSTDECCEIVTLRSGEDEPEHITFTIKDAHALGLAGRDQWKNQPAVMLHWRCVSKAARQVYPDVILGLHTEDEIADRGETPEIILIPKSTNKRPLAEIVKDEPKKKAAKQAPKSTPPREPAPEPQPAQEETPPVQDAEYETEPEQPDFSVPDDIEAQAEAHFSEPTPAPKSDTPTQTQQFKAIVAYAVEKWGKAQVSRMLDALNANKAMWDGLNVPERQDVIDLFKGFGDGFPFGVDLPVGIIERLNICGPRLEVWYDVWDKIGKDIKTA